MKKNIYLTAKNGDYDAKGTYEDGTITVLPGSKIRLDFAAHIRGGTTALNYRNDPKSVDSNGIVLKNCSFTSASTSAQFVTGRSTNGLEAWRVDSETKLKDWLEKK